MQATAQCHSVLWGGRPRPRPAPWPAIRIWLKTRQAGRGRPARVRGPAPLFCAEVGKLSDIGLSAGHACILAGIFVLEPAAPIAPAPAAAVAPKRPAASAISRRIIFRAWPRWTDWLG